MIQRNLNKALDAIRRKFNTTPSTSKPWTWAYRDSDGNWKWDERPVSTIEEIQESMIEDMWASIMDDPSPEPEPDGSGIDWDHITIDVYYGHLCDSEWTLVLYRLPHQDRWDILVLHDDHHVSHMDHTFAAATTKLAKEYATDWAIRIKGLTENAAGSRPLKEAAVDRPHH